MRNIFTFLYQMCKNNDILPGGGFTNGLGPKIENMVIKKEKKKKKTSTEIDERVAVDLPLCHKRSVIIQSYFLD